MNKNKSIVRTHNRKDADFRLFCFPFAGAGASIFNSWEDELSENIELCSVQLSGRESRIDEKVVTSMPSLVDELFVSMTEFIDKPFAFFGHSMGGLIAFELARRLITIEKQPEILIVSGITAPQSGYSSSYHKMPYDEFYHTALNDFGINMDHLDDKIVHELMKIMHEDFELIENYQFTPSDPIDTKLVGFWGLRDSVTNNHDMEKWRELTDSEFELKPVDGDHMFLISKQTELIQEINQYVNDVCNQ